MRGTVIAINDISRGEWDIAQVVVYTKESKGDKTFENFYPFELFGDKAKIAQEVMIGDDVEVKYHTKGRKWTNEAGEDKYFVSLSAWAIDVLGNEEAESKQSDPEPSDSLPF